MPGQPYERSAQAYTVNNDVLAGNVEREQQITRDPVSEERRRKADAAALERSLRRAELQGSKVAKEARALRSLNDQAHGQGVEVHPPVTFRHREYGGTQDDQSTISAYIVVNRIVHRVLINGRLTS